MYSTSVELVNQIWKRTTIDFCSTFYDIF